MFFTFICEETTCPFVFFRLKTIIFFEKKSIALRLEAVFLSQAKEGYDEYVVDQFNTQEKVPVAP